MKIKMFNRKLSLLNCAPSKKELRGEQFEKKMSYYSVLKVLYDQKEQDKTLAVYILLRLEK